MTESAGFPPSLDVPYDQAAAAAVDEVQQGPVADAGASLGQMSVDRPEPLPAESDMDRLMSEFKAMSERVQAMEAELGQAKSGYAAAVAKLGPPDVVTYARGIVDKLHSLRNANPDVPPGHFDSLITKAGPLGQAAQDVIDGKGHVQTVVDELPDVVSAVERFVDKTHPRRSGKPLDFSSLLYDVEMAAEAAAKIAAVV